LAKLLDIPRKEKGPSFRGKLMLDTVRGTLRVRKWPKKRGKAKSALQQQWIDWFTQANFLAKYASGYDQVAAIERSKGTGLYPRDLILKAMRGRLLWWVDQDGWRWYPMAAIGDISETLDVLGQTVGSLLARFTDRWRPVPLNNTGDVLTSQGPLAVPVFAAPAGPAPSFVGCAVENNANQSIANATFTALTWQVETFDDASIHDPAVNPSRLTVPAGWTKVRLSAGISWASGSAGERQILFWKNGATFNGHAKQRKKPHSSSDVTTVSRPLIVVPGDYFEVAVYQTNGGNLNVSGPHKNVYFSMEKLA